MLALFEQTTLAENSYQLSIKEGALLWNTEEGHREVQYSHEPKTGIWKRLLVRLIALLPAENLL